MPALRKFDPDNPEHQALRHPDDIKKFGRDPSRNAEGRLVNSEGRSPARRGTPQSQPRPSAIKGRKKCTVCGQLPKSMTEHWQGLAGEQFQAHGPVSSNNPQALKNFPGLKKISEDLGSLFNNRRSW